MGMIGLLGVGKATLQHGLGDARVGGSPMFSPTTRMIKPRSGNELMMMDAYNGVS